VQVKLLTGAQKGRVVMLPRCSIPVSQDNSGLPFAFTRVQFPLIPAYCVSVHKSQGQTLDKVGMFMEYPVFAHGQLYTALSRTSGWDCLVVCAPGDLTNIVMQHVL